MMKSLSHLNEKDLTHHHPNKILINTVSEPSDAEKQFQNVLKTFVIFPTAESQHNLRLFLEDGVPNIEEKLKRQTENHGPVKWIQLSFKRPCLPLKMKTAPFTSVATVRFQDEYVNQHILHANLKIHAPPPTHIPSRNTFKSVNGFFHLYERFKHNITASTSAV